MTFNEIEKSSEKFEKHIDSFYGDGTGHFTSGAKTIHVGDAYKNFLKQSFIKYLQGEVERLVLESQRAPFGQSQANIGYRRAKFEEIATLEAQLKELQ